MPHHKEELFATHWVMAANTTCITMSYLSCLLSVRIIGHEIVLQIEL